MINLLLVDDHEVVREALASWLKAKLDDVRSFEAASCEEALACLHNEPVELVIFDLHLPDTQGVGGLAALLESFPKQKIVVLSGDKDPALIKAAFDLGAKSFVLKDSGTQELLKAIEISLDDGCYLPDEVTQLLEQGRPGLEDIDALTPREKDVLGLMLQGLSNKLIARKLAPIEESTVKAHAGHIFRKLNVRNRSEVLALALDRGIKAQLLQNS